MRRSLAIVLDARVERPEAVKSLVVRMLEVRPVVEALPRVVCPVTTMFVDVEFPTMRLVTLRSDATRLEKNPLVLVAFDAMRLVVEAFVIVAFVVVLFPKTAFVMLARVATRDAIKELVLVALVTIADVADRRPLTDADEMLVVASTV